eukprot:TRINITY_DN47652_c0_g1_i1.p1 TRINITY_DN47652_c0_g1~~TRINITY_DN47652_c0_g1_i1.p1  ORF type:complete len:589 (+),score=102.58 TRINITY_DN47652_c0_g1_i1:35-1768(+)
MSGAQSATSSATRSQSYSAHYHSSKEVELKNIHGDLHSLRSQFRHLHKKVQAINPEDAARLRTEMNHHRQNFQTSMQQLKDTDALANDVASVKLQVQSMSGSFQELGSMQKQIQSINSSLQHEVAGVKQQMQSVQANLKELSSMKQHLTEVASMKQQMQKELNQLQTMRQEHKTVQQTVQSVKRETDNVLRELAPLRNGTEVAKAVQKEVSKLTAELGAMRSGDVGSIKMVVSATSKDLHELRKQIYDSGVLVRKAEVEDHHDEHPPVGSIELGEDMFSARLLVRLGFLKARQDKLLEEGGESPSELTMQKLVSSDSECEERNERTLYLAEEQHMVRFDDVVSGILVPEVKEGGLGYNKVTYGWLAVCLMTMFTQVLAVIVLLRHSFARADICRDKPADASSKLTLRLAKGCAVFVAGTIMGKELMDTVNYLMVSELLMGHSPESLLSAFTRLATVILIACANVMSFTCSDDASDVFMNMTALSFLGELGTFGLEVAKRGVLGHHVGKTMTELNFSISILKVYPDWFKTIRDIAVFFQFGFSAFFITLLVVFLDIPDCNPDGSSPGKVYDQLLPWNW